MLTMFKKRERKVQSQNTRRKRDEDDGSDDSDIDQSGPVNSNDELQSILAKTKQRRTLMHQLQYKRGVDAHDLLQQGNKSDGVVDDLNNENVDDTVGSVARSNANLSARVDALSSKTQLPTGGTIVAEEQRIWDQKHAAAMEEYVQQKLLEKSSSFLQQHSSNESEVHPSTDKTTIKNLATAKEQLYRELAAQAARLSGKSSASSTTDPNRVSSQPQRHDDSSSSGDVVTAGAATAIMEVILPIDDRLQAVAATAHAAANTNNAEQQQQNMPYVRNKASAVPNRFRSSYNHHHPMVHNNNNTNGNKKRLYDNNDVTTESPSSSMDKDRPGFAVARQLQQQQQQQHRSYQNSGGANNNQNSNHQQSRSTDDRVYQQFIKRQREQHGR